MWYNVLKDGKNGGIKMNNVMVEDFTIGSICQRLCDITYSMEFFSIELKKSEENDKKEKKSDEDMITYTYKSGVKMNNEKCIDLVLGILVYNKPIPYEEDPFEDIDGPNNGYKRTRLLQHNYELSDKFCKIINQTSIDNLKDNVHSLLELCVKEYNVKKDILEFARDIALRGIREPYTTEEVFREFLKKYPDGNYKFNGNFLDDVTNVFAKSLMIAFHTSNKNRYETDLFNLVPSIRKKSKDQYIYDPHKTFSYTEAQLAQSTALKFCLISNRKKEHADVRVYYSVDRLLKFILDNACIIQNVQVDEKTDSVNVIVESFYNDGYTLEWCDEQMQIDACVELVKEYRSEFHKKLSWKSHGYRIDKMCEDGLGHGLDGKWRALAYFHMYHGSEKDICAFCDIKRRIDSNCELGIAICQSSERNRDLVSSIIYFHVLNEFGSYIYGGTYDGNIPMMKIFKKCGFEEHLNYDYDSREASYRVKERFITDTPPENPDDFGDSVYYQRRSLQSEVIDKFIVERSKRLQNK